jgi:negative regulator of sigma E activity
VEPNLTVARHAATRDLLGAFALGAVDAEEAATVRAHLATCAECQAEMAELWLAVDSLPGMIEPIEPPPALRDRIAAAIRAEAASPAPVPSALSAPPAREPAPAVPEPIRKPASFWSRATPWAAAAAVLLLLAAGLLVWNLRLREQIQEATAPVAETIALAPTDAAPGARGEVTYRPQDRLFLLDVRDLPPLKPDQVYEVWLIGANGPKPAGTFDRPTDQHAIVADRDLYNTLAITAEPGPLGTEAPTGEIVATASL